MNIILIIGMSFTVTALVLVAMSKTKSASKTYRFTSFKYENETPMVIQVTAKSTIEAYQLANEWSNIKANTNWQKVEVLDESGQAIETILDMNNAFKTNEQRLNK